jgi:hypothetical protein
LKEQLPGCAFRTLGVAFDPEVEKRRFVVHVASTDIPDAAGAYMTTLAVQVSNSSKSFQAIYHNICTGAKQSRGEQMCHRVDPVARGPAFKLEYSERNIALLDAYCSQMVF